MKPVNTFSIFLLLLLPACGSVRHTVQTQSLQKDSSVAQNLQRNSSSSSIEKQTLIRDSIIRIPARQVMDTLDATALQQAVTATGKPVSRKYEKTEKGVQAYLNVLPGGQVTYGCNVDSYTIVVQSLMREQIVINNRYDSLQALYIHNSKEVATAERSTTTKVRSFLAAIWPYLLALAVIILAACFVKYFLKWPGQK